MMRVKQCTNPCNLAGVFTYNNVQTKPNNIMTDQMKKRIADFGTKINTVGELRSLLEDLDDHDQLCIETIDDQGDSEDLYPMYVDVIEGIRLVNDTIVREIRFCQMPNGEPDTRDKQTLVGALIDVLAEDMVKGDTTVLDELLLKMPYDILKYALPEDMWADFE